MIDVADMTPSCAGPTAEPIAEPTAGPIYHLALTADWDAAREVGEYRVSTLGRSLDEVGFVHCSFAGQVAGTLRRFYADVREAMVLLTLDPAQLDATVVVEAPAPGAELFPHVYGPIPVRAVTAVTRLRRGADGRWVAPSLP